MWNVLMKLLGRKEVTKVELHQVPPLQAIGLAGHNGSGSLRLPRKNYRKIRTCRRNQRRMHHITGCRPTY